MKNLLAYFGKFFKKCSIFFPEFGFGLKSLPYRRSFFLVVHLAGHGIGLFLENAEHVHGEHAANFFSVETLIGVGALILFVWIWHRPTFKKWIPCSHEHCHHKIEIPHLLAIIALCIHFSLRRGVRHALLQGLQTGGFINIIGAVGFVAHFFVDVIVAMLLAFISKTWQQKFLHSFYRGIVDGGILFWKKYHRRTARVGRRNFIRGECVCAGDVCTHAAPTDFQMSHV